MIEFIGWFFVCLWAADFITGVAHWAEDTYCDDGYPLIGKLICEPNRLHHEDPNLMVRTGTFLSRNYIQWLLAIWACLSAYFFGYFSWQFALMALMGSFGNEVHRWNHMSKPGKLIQFFKDLGIIQAQKQHSLHHKKPHDSYYCVLTSQVNPVLEALNFWRITEAGLSLIGIKPKTK